MLTFVHQLPTLQVCTSYAPDMWYLQLPTLHLVHFDIEIGSVHQVPTLDLYTS